MAAAAVALALSAAACGSDEPDLAVGPLPATLAQLLGPWQATPFALDGPTWTRIEDACRRDIEMGPGTRAVIIDARGAGVVTVRMTGRQAGHCDALQVTESGTIESAGSGNRSDGPEQAVIQPGTQIGPVEQGAIQGGSLAVAGWFVHGPVGGAIATVVIQVPDRPQVVATVMNGQFEAWWPAPPNWPKAGGGLGLPGTPPAVQILGYDAAGTLVNQIHN